PVTHRATTLAGDRLCRSLPRQLVAGAIVLALFCAADAAIQRQPQRLSGRGDRAGPEYRRLWRRGLTRRHPLDTRRPVRGLSGAEYVRLAAHTTHHPAAGAAGSDPT